MRWGFLFAAITVDSLLIHDHVRRPVVGECHIRGNDRVGDLDAFGALRREDDVPSPGQRYYPAVPDAASHCDDVAHCCLDILIPVTA